MGSRVKMAMDGRLDDSLASGVAQAARVNPTS